jgi:spermidine synthase
MLVGGLGLGYTAVEALRLGVGSLDVVEIEDCLVQWARNGATAIWARLAAE